MTDNYMGLDMNDVKAVEYASLQSQYQQTPDGTRSKIGEDWKLYSDSKSYEALNAAEVQQSKYTTLNRNPSSGETEEEVRAYIVCIHKSGGRCHRLRGYT